MNNHLTRLETEVSGALDALKDPLSGRGLIASGRVQGLNVHEDGRVGFTIEAPAAPGALVENSQKLRDSAEAAVRKVRGVKRVMAVLTAEAAGGPARPAPRPT